MPKHGLSCYAKAQSRHDSKENPGTAGTVAGGNSTPTPSIRKGISMIFSMSYHHCNTSVAAPPGSGDGWPKKPRYPIPYPARQLRRRWPSLSPSVARLIAEQARLGGVE
tara:strand:+ start:1026 stop:1352 length:327 start_codon:yes stop_codon:yes gene_type:complete